MQFTQQAAPQIERPLMESKKPFPDTLKAILETEEVTHRELSRRCKERGWGALGTINRLVNGELRPSMRAMAAVAAALRVKPETFAEYRLGAMREQLDPEVAGLKKALRTLDRCQGR